LIRLLKKVGGVGVDGTTRRIRSCKTASGRKGEKGSQRKGVGLRFWANCQRKKKR